MSKLINYCKFSEHYMYFCLKTIYLSKFSYYLNSINLKIGNFLFTYNRKFIMKGFNMICNHMNYESNLNLFLTKRFVKFINSLNNNTVKVIKISILRFFLKAVLILQR